MTTSLFADKRFQYFIQIWWLLVSLMQFAILRQLDVDVYHAVIDALCSAGLLGFISFLLSNNMRYYLPREEKYWYILISSIVGCGIWLIFLLLAFKLIFPDNDPYLLFLRESMGIRFGAGFLLISSLIMFSMLLYSQQEQKDIQARQAEAEKLAKESELFKLRQQLQPHFLFNSLNSISSLTATDPQKARHMIQQLSEFLRGMLRKDEEKLISLADELQYIRLYLEIEKVRFGHRLQTEIFCSARAESCLLPPLILQPVVENAIKFGLYDTVGDVLIRITAEKTDHDLRVDVTNPFDPETSAPVKGTGFGISSISRRLFLIFSRKDLVHTNALGTQYTTTVLIPQL